MNTATTEATIKEIPVGDIVPVHEVRDYEKLDALRDSMAESGWGGRPLLVILFDGIFHAITGSHRLQAAIEANMETVPCVTIDADAIDRAGYGPDYMLSLDDETRSLFLNGIFGTDAACSQLMAQELE